MAIWERTHPFLTIDISTAEALLRQWQAGARIERLELLAGGLVNSNYRVIMPGEQTVMLRLYAREEAWRKELAVYQMVHQEIPVAALHDLGNLPAACPAPFAIFAYIDGVTLDRHLAEGEPPAPALAAEIGETLARLHGHAFDRVGFFDDAGAVATPLPPPSTWPHMFLQQQRTLERLGSELADRLSALLEQRQTDLHALDHPITLAHGDFRPANLLIRQGRLAAVLDWEFALAGPPWLDLGAFLRDDRISPAFIERVVSSYQRNTTFPLPERWMNLARLMDLAPLLQMLGAEEERPTRYAEIVSLITRTVHHVSMHPR